MEIRSLLSRGRGLIDEGRYAEAVQALQSAVHEAPGFADLHHQLGLALSLVGEPLRAESHLQRALEINPQYAEAHLNLAILLFERSAYATARVHLREFDTLARGNGQGFPEPALDDLARRHAALAERYRAYGLLQESENELRAALRLRPAYGDVRLGLARVLYERAKLDESTRELDQLLQETPEYDEALLLRGRVELARGRPDAARHAWLQVRQGSSAIQARAYLELLESEGRTAPGRWPAGRLAGSKP